MLKRILIAAAATAVLGATALPIQFQPAEAAMTCKDAAKAKFPKDLKMRHEFKKQCKAAWKASQKAPA
jgi:hypothetical protein